MTDPLHARAYKLTATQIADDIRRELAEISRLVEDMKSNWESAGRLPVSEVGRLAHTTAGLAVLAGKHAAHNELTYLLDEQADAPSAG